jgi:hypothetical protein
MQLPLRANLLYIQADAIDARDGVLVGASLVDLTDELVDRQMSAGWWQDDAINLRAAELEIDRHWDWRGTAFGRDGRDLRAIRLALITDHGAVQGAMMMSADGVAMGCSEERGKLRLFVELLFAAPRNRPEVIRQKNGMVFRGTGLNLIQAAVQISDESGHAVRLKLDASPRSVKWYANRGFITVSERHLVYDSVGYTPMELKSEAARPLRRKTSSSQ